MYHFYQLLVKSNVLKIMTQNIYDNMDPLMFWYLKWFGKRRESCASKKNLTPTCILMPLIFDLIHILPTRYVQQSILQYGELLYQVLFVLAGSFKFTLCAKPPDRNQKKGQDLRYTFLNSSWHTDAKKIPEKLIYRRHLACFFQKTKFFWKIFFG